MSHVFKPATESSCHRGVDAHSPLQAVLEPAYAGRLESTMTEQDLKRLARNAAICELRSRGWSQRSLAQRFGVSRPLVSHFSKKMTVPNYSLKAISLQTDVSLLMLRRLLSEIILHKSSSGDRRLTPIQGRLLIKKVRECLSPVAVKCLECGKSFSVSVNDHVRKFCSSSCCVNHQNKKTVWGKKDSYPEIVELRAATDKHRSEQGSAADITWVMSRNARLLSELTSSELWYRTDKGILVIKRHPTETWCGKPLVMWSTAELLITRQIRRKYKL